MKELVLVGAAIETLGMKIEEIRSLIVNQRMACFAFVSEWSCAELPEKPEVVPSIIEDDFPSSELVAEFSACDATEIPAASRECWKASYFVEEFDETIRTYREADGTDCAEFIFDDGGVAIRKISKYTGFVQLLAQDAAMLAATWGGDEAFWQAVAIDGSDPAPTKRNLLGLRFNPKGYPVQHFRVNPNGIWVNIEDVRRANRIRRPFSRPDVKAKNEERSAKNQAEIIELAESIIARKVKLVIDRRGGVVIKALAEQIELHAGEKWLDGAAPMSAARMARLLGKCKERLQTRVEAQLSADSARIKR
ncbi:MAG: hypothetical protein OMOMHJEC_03352 [Xanthomonadales bacterium]|nr:hypothetical protein [Xanthomonadales bacterium]